MKRAVIIICWICVIAAGSFLRFDGLGKRPFHADEATGARITARRMEDGGPAFDPRHFHGPLLADLAMPLCRARGERTWQAMTRETLRGVPAAAGVLMVMVPLLWRRRMGEVPALAAGALLATSPLLVYYSRMFIHEIPLALCGLLALTALCRLGRRAAWIAAGVLLGLMFALKESVAVSVLAWAAAACLVALENRRLITREAVAAAWARWWRPAAAGVAAGALVAMVLYTDGFRHPAGAVDAVRTFFVYETVDGHDKAWWYYADLLLGIRKSGGVWWFGTGVFALAVFAFGCGYSSSCGTPGQRACIRFIGWSAAGHLAIYSLFSYKTPWLACLPWAHVCLLAGFAMIPLARGRALVRIAAGCFVAACLATQARQAVLASGRLASSARNPFAYVPTQRDVESIGPWLKKLAASAPGGTVEPIAIVGSGYWPLPWYLRDFRRIGYWPAPTGDVAALPVVFATDDVGEAMGALLAPSHTALPRGLRDGAPVVMFVRNDIWNRWMEGGGP